MVYLSIFICLYFAGAPIIESTHNEIKFTAPLTAITAAVVGVILNLALFLVITCYGHRVFQAILILSRPLITVAAFIALFRFNINVLYVILLRHWLDSLSLSFSYLLIELIS